VIQELLLEPINLVERVEDVNTLRRGAFKLFKCTFPGSKQFK